MKVEFKDEDLESLEGKDAKSGDFSLAVCRGYRKALRAIRAAKDQKDLYALRGLRFEKLSGDREDQYSVRCNKQFRLIMEFSSEGTVTVVLICEIVDYHK